MPLIMFVSSSFNTYVNLPKKKNNNDPYHLVLLTTQHTKYISQMIKMLI